MCNVSTTCLDNTFEQELHSATDECKNLKRSYNPIVFTRMLAGYGAVEASKLLLANVDGRQNGFTALWERG